MNPAHLLQTADLLDPGFLNNETHARRYQAGESIPRKCRWCSTVLEWILPHRSPVLACSHCDPVARL